MDEPTVELSLADSWTTHGETGRRTFHAHRLIYGQRAVSLELEAGTRQSYPRSVVDDVRVADGVEIVRAGNPR